MIKFDPFKFYLSFLQDPTRACYGPKHVEVAHERMAVQTLLVTDELFRSVILACILFGQFFLKKTSTTLFPAL